MVSPLHLFLNYRSIVEVLNNQKQSVSNAFRYVVLYPAALPHSLSVPSGKMQLQKYKDYLFPQSFFSLNLKKVWFFPHLIVTLRYSMIIEESDLRDAQMYET